jgi:hypothetical protein
VPFGPAAEFVVKLGLREEQRLRVFENRMLRKVFGPEMDEVTREYRGLNKAS